MQQTLSEYQDFGGNAIFLILKDHKWHSSAELSQAAKQYNARIYELRREGCCILSEKRLVDGKNHVFGYRMME